MSNIDKQALRERHTFHIAPHCHICGTKMTIARMQAGRFEYACSGCTYDDNGAHYALGRSLGDEHYSASYVTIHDLSDPDVIKVLDELEAAEKRIAELEAHPYLPQPLNIKDEYQNYEYVSGWNDCRNAANVREHTAAIRDVIAERYRQQSVEGWTPEHDDQYMHCEMAVAAACYIMADDDPRAGVPELWPWPEEWWKPTTIRRDLVKAGALILAEIERIDRAAGIGKGDSHES